MARMAANMAPPSPWTVPTSVAKKPLTVTMLRVLIPKASENAPIFEKLSAIFAMSPFMLSNMSRQAMPRPPTTRDQIRKYLRLFFSSRV